MYSRVLLDLTKKEIGSKQSEEQAGFKSGRSNIDVCTIKIACEERVNRNWELHIALVCLTKLYDNTVTVMGIFKEGRNTR